MTYEEQAMDAGASTQEEIREMADMLEAQDKYWEEQYYKDNSWELLSEEEIEELKREAVND